jgi:hypothetical protein
VGSLVIAKEKVPGQVPWYLSFYPSFLMD